MATAAGRRSRAASSQAAAATSGSTQSPCLPGRCVCFQARLSLFQRPEHMLLPERMLLSKRMLLCLLDAAYALAILWPP